MKLVAAFVTLLLTIGIKPDDTINSRFNMPEGYAKVHYPSNTFANWLDNLPLTPAGTHTQTYRGDIARTDAYTAAVIDMSIGKQDLQQCADAVMRLRAEYQYQQKDYAAIAFNFTSGFRCDYLHYANGYRFKNGKWLQNSTKSYSYATFMQYMNLVFSYAGTLSLEKELEKVSNENDLKAGDVFIYGGSPGHCFIILAVAENSAHQRKFLLAQSFMPAQNIQILKQNGDPWFTLNQPANIPYGKLVSFKYLRKFKH